MLRQDESAGGMWGWVAGLAVLAFIACILIAGWNSSSNTAINNPPPGTTAPVRNVTPQSTTGSGSISPQPATPSPATPAPARSGAQ